MTPLSLRRQQILIKKQKYAARRDRLATTDIRNSEKRFHQDSSPRTNKQEQKHSMQMNSDASGMRTDHLGWMVSSDMDRPRSFHFDGCTLLGRRDGDGESKTPA